MTSTTINDQCKSEETSQDDMMAGKQLSSPPPPSSSSDKEGKQLPEQKNPQPNHDKVQAAVVFNHLSKKNKDLDKNDIRRLFRDELTSKAINLDFDSIESMIIDHPELCAIKYLFRLQSSNQYARSSSKELLEIYPISRILCFKPPLSTVKKFVEAFPAALKCPDKDGRYSLHYACRFGAGEDVIEYVADQYVDAVKIPTIEWEHLPIHYAISHCTMDTVKYLIDVYPDCLTVKKSFDKLTVLLQACREFKDAESPSEWEQMILYILSKRPEMAAAYAKKKNGLPIHNIFYGTSSPSTQLVQALIDAHPESVYKTNPKGELVLHLACGSRAALDDRVIKLLLEANPNAASVKVGVDGGGGVRTPLHNAVGFYLLTTIPTLVLLIAYYPEGLRITTLKGHRVIDKAKSSLRHDQSLLEKQDDKIEFKNAGGYHKNIGMDNESLQERIERKERIVLFLSQAEEKVKKLIPKSIEERIELLNKIVEQLPQPARPPPPPPEQLPISSSATENRTTSHSSSITSSTVSSSSEIALSKLPGPTRRRITRNDNASTDRRSKEHQEDSEVVKDDDIAKKVDSDTTTVTTFRERRHAELQNLVEQERRSSKNMEPLPQPLPGAYRLRDGVVTNNEISTRSLMTTTTMTPTSATENDLPPVVATIAAAEIVPDNDDVENMKAEIDALRLQLAAATNTNNQQISNDYGENDNAPANSSSNGTKPSDSSSLTTTTVAILSTSDNAASNVVTATVVDATNVAIATRASTNLESTESISKPSNTRQKGIGHEGEAATESSCSCVIQ